MPFYTKEGENTTQIYSEIKKKRNLKTFSRRVFATLKPVPNPINPKAEKLLVEMQVETNVPYKHRFRHIQTIPDSWENKDGLHEPHFGTPIERKPGWETFEVTVASFFIKNYDSKEIEAVVIYSKEPIK
jgi:hypothetical protein